MMQDKKTPIERRKVYIAFVIISLVLAIVRLFFMRDETFLLHFTLTVASFAGFMISWEFILYVGGWLEKRFPQTTKLYFKATIQILITYCFMMLLATSVRYTVVSMFHTQAPRELVIFAFLLFFMISIVLNLIYFGTIYFNDWKENLVRTAILQHEKARVNYDALRNQLNPHFLFNALTSLNSLIFENQQLASDYLQQLSKMFRYTLLHKNKEAISIQTEVDFVNNYIFLVKTRYANAVEFNISINENGMDRGIVPVTLQVLIENGLKHNIVSADRPLKFSILNDGDYLIIENTVNKKLNVETSNKLGLQNLKSLYQYLSERPVEIIENENKFTVKIPLL